MATQKINKATFLTQIADFENSSADWKFLGERPAIVDFYADWCNPCRQLAPVLEDLSEELAGQVDFYKVNVDEESELANVFGIRSIPTLLFIPKDGQPQMSQGGMPRHLLKQAIDEVLLNK